jgi:hypothetical protein
VQFVAFAYFGLEIFQLVNRLVGGHKSDVFSLSTKIGCYNLGKSYEVDDVNRVKTVIEVISDLMDTVMS